MAYYDPNEENQDPNAQAQAQTGPGGGVISGQGSTPTAPAPAATNAPDKPGNFVGIQQYLDQNKPQAAKLAENVGSFVSGQGEAAKTALQEGQNQFDQAVGQNTVSLDQNLFNQAKTSPDQVDSDAQKKSDFQKMRDASYQGPASLESSDYYQPINLAIQNALGTADRTQSASGRSSILSDMQKQNNQRTSPGVANLDSALLSASPDSRTILSKARDQITPLGDQLKAVTEAENMKAKSAADQTAATQKAIQDAFSGASGVQGTLQSDLQSRAAAASKSSGADADSILSALKAGNPNLTDHQLQILGINRNQYNGLLNDQQYYKDLRKATPLSDLSSFATKLPTGNQITPQSIATPEDYAKYSALNDLMGTSNGFLNDPSQAGKANLDTLNFNYASTPSAVSDRISSLRFAPVNPDTQNPILFSDANKTYNLNTSPQSSAHLAIGLAQGLSRPDEKAQVNSYNSLLTNSLNMLDKINKTYGTNLTLPKDYYNRAVSAVKSNLQKEFNDWPSPYKKMPDAGVIDQAARTTAMITYLNDLQKDVSKVRG